MKSEVTPTPSSEPVYPKLLGAQKEKFLDSLRKDFEDLGLQPRRPKARGIPFPGRR